MATTNSVNVPTNQKIKEKDINTKLQLYGIFEGSLLLTCRVSRAPPASENFQLTQFLQRLRKARCLRYAQSAASLAIQPH